MPVDTEQVKKTLHTQSSGKYIKISLKLIQLGFSFSTDIQEFLWVFCS